MTGKEKHFLVTARFTKEVCAFIPACLPAKVTGSQLFDLLSRCFGIRFAKPQTHAVFASRKQQNGEVLIQFLEDPKG